MSSGLGIDYAMKTDEALQKRRAQYSYGTVIDSKNNDNSIFNGNDSSGTNTNTCTDGEDDGKIGFWSKVGNFAEGIWNMGKNAVKQAIKHPFKTLAGIALCCIPVVGPYIGMGFAAYGLYNSGKAIINGAQAAKNAKTDAEAKAAWENIGAGTGGAVASAVALKGSAGLLKGQLTGGSATVNAVRAAKGTGIKNIAKTAVEEGIKETGSNLYAVADNTVGKAWRQGKKYYNAAKSGKGIKQQFTDDVATMGKRAGEWAGDKIEKADNFRKKHFTKDGKQQLATEKQTQIKAQIDKGTRIEMKDGKPVNNNGQFTEKNGHWEMKQGNTTKVYDSDGALMSTTETANGVTTEIQYKNGTPYKTTVTDKSGKTVTTEGKTSTKEEYTVVDKDGNELTDVNIESKNGNSYNKYSDGSSSGYNPNTGESYTTTKVVDADGKVSYETEFKIRNSNGDLETVSSKDLLPGQAKAYRRTINDGKINQILDYQIKGLGNATNPFLMGAGTIIIEEEIA